MTITNGYCTLDDLKHQNRLNIASSDSDSNPMLEGIIEAISRKIDDRCDRRFWADSDTSIRYYTPLSSTYVFIDDMASYSSDTDIEISIDQNGDGVFDDTLSSADFVLSPYNAELDGTPYQKIEVSSNGNFLLPKGVKKSVKIRAKWGWRGGTPKAIWQACLLQSERLFKRFATPLGSESMTALGKMTLTIPNLDPDVEMLISRYIKPRWG
jgi:hypothetical protein